MSEYSFPFSLRQTVQYPADHWRMARWQLAAGAVVLAMALAGCGDKSAAGGSGMAGMPPAEVGVLTVQTGEVGLLSELPGRLEASRVAQVRARAAGILQQQLFREGSDVKAGQTLFRIDAAPYDAALASAEAQLARAEAMVRFTTAGIARYKPLADAKAVSELDYVNADTQHRQAQADVLAAKAAVMTARINRGYADVASPISGRIGRALVTEGALVGQGDATALAVVQQIDPLYVNFTQSASEAMGLARAIESGRYKRAGKGAAAVTVVLEDGSEHPQAGKLLFTDLTVDGTSGQVTLRAEVPNPGGRLLPGLYVRVRLVQAQASQAVLLPQQAVTRLPEGDSVMVVQEGKAVPRPVKIGGQQNGQWIVLDGLQPGEQVMVDGFQKLMFGGPIKPVPWHAPGEEPKNAKAAAEPAAAAQKSAN